MNCNLEEMKKRMPEVIRDVDYFNHIVIHQNDEIIRLLKKIAGETNEVIEPIELVEPIQEEVAIQTMSLEDANKKEVAVEEALTKAKSRRKKKEV